MISTRSVQAPHRTCILCGRRDRKITGEHILGAWLTRYVGPGHYLAARTAENPLRRKIEKRWPTAKVAEIKVNDICQECNGRMADAIETPVQAILKPMISGQHVQLSSEHQKAVALWLYKIAVLFRYVEVNPREASPDELKDLLEPKRPRAGTRIFVGHYRGSYRVRIVAHQLGKLRVLQGPGAIDELLARTRGKQWEYQEHVVVAVGEFCAQVSLYPPRSSFTYGANAAVMRQIWPTIGPSEWPPPFHLDDGGLASLGDLTLTS